MMMKVIIALVLLAWVASAVYLFNDHMVLDFDKGEAAFKRGAYAAAMQKV